MSNSEQDGVRLSLPPQSAQQADSEYLEINSEGRLRLYGERTQRSLLSRHGRWRLLETDADLVLFLRQDEVSPSVHIPRGRVLLAGDLSGPASPVELLSFLQTLRATCWAVFSDGPVQKSLVFYEGDLLAVQSNQTADRLGEVLFRWGTIDRSSLEAALAAAGPQRRLGQILRDNGDITAQELWQSVRRQMEEVFFSVLAMNRGTFCVLQAAVDQFPTRMALDTRRLVFEGLRRQDELREFRKRLPHDDILIERHPSDPGGNIPPDMLQVLEPLVTRGPQTVAQLCRSSQLGPFHGLRAIHAALEQGLVRVGLRRPGSLPPNSGTEAAR